MFSISPHLASSKLCMFILLPSHIKIYRNHKHYRVKEANLKKLQKVYVQLQDILEKAKLGR